MYPLYPSTRLPGVATVMHYPLPCLLLILCACSCTVNVQLVNPHPQPLPVSGQCVILDQNDPPPIDGDSLGVVSYLNYFALGQDNYHSQQLLRSAARRTGANLIKITTYLTYHQGRALYEQFIATLYKVDNIQPYEKVIQWKGYPPLTFADFKSRPYGRTATTRLSHSECRIWGAEARFNCLTSWIDSTSVNASRLLRHEQGNFDLTECYNRQLRPLLRFQFYHLPARKLPAAEKIEAAYLAKRAEYDSLTDGGLDEARQSEWTSKIAYALADNTDTSFRVPPETTAAQKDSLAKSLTPPPDKALVYIIRPKSYTSSLPRRMLLNVFVDIICPYALFLNPTKYQVYYSDGKSTGRIPAHQYTYLYLDPGDNSFTSSIYGLDWTSDSPHLDLLLAPGKTYYLRLDMPSQWFGLYAKPRLLLISNEEGRKLLWKCRLAKPNNDASPLTDDTF